MSNEEKKDSEERNDRDETIDSLMNRVKYYEQEMKKVVSQRDEYKDKYKSIEQATREPDSDVGIKQTKAELVAAYERADKERNELRDLFETQKRESEKTKKIDVLKSEATKFNIKPSYLDKLPMFCSLDKVDLESPTSVRILVEDIRAELPDLFEQKTSTQPKKLTVVDTLNTDELEKEYYSAQEKGDFERAKEVWTKIMELKGR